MVIMQIYHRVSDTNNDNWNFVSVIFENDEWEVGGRRGINCRVHEK